MKPAEIIYFATVLLCALTALIEWKRRRDTIAARLNRGLRGYVDAKSGDSLPVCEETHGAGMMPV